MDNQNSKKDISPDIPKQIFGKFLEELKSVEIPPEIIERLKGVIFDKEIPNDEAINAALFNDIQNI